MSYDRVEPTEGYAIRIVRRCAAYVRGFYARDGHGQPGPVVFDTLQHVANMLDAQPFAIVSSVLAEEPDLATSVNLGDRMRMSVELIRAMQDQPNPVVVRVISIRIEDDGTKTLWLNVDQ